MAEPGGWRGKRVERAFLTNKLQPKVENEDDDENYWF